MSFPTRTTTVAPGMAPRSTASLNACSTSRHPKTHPLPPRQFAPAISFMRRAARHCNRASPARIKNPGKEGSDFDCQTERNGCSGGLLCRLRDGGFGKRQSAEGGVDPHPHAERYREVLGAVTGLDTGQHRNSQAGGLMGYEIGDRAGLGFASIDRPNSAENHGGDAGEDTRLPQLHEHPVYSICALARILQEEHLAAKVGSERRR